VDRDGVGGGAGETLKGCLLELLSKNSKGRFLKKMRFGVRIKKIHLLKITRALRMQDRLGEGITKQL
jgi:hypothetical protein